MSDTADLIDQSDLTLPADISLIAGISAVPGILDVVCRTTGMGFAAVARVTDTQWIACAVQDNVAFGLKPGSELELKSTICDEIRDSRTPVIFDDAQLDPLYVDHHTPKLYGLRSYISFPIIRASGEMFGTLCAIDPLPRRVSSPETREMFRLFAELIAFHIDAADQLEASASHLKVERDTALLRDQFIAILGHDLRNPVASLEAGLTLLKRSELSDRGRSLIAQMEASVHRIGRLIEDVLDFARGSLGEGLSLELQGDEQLRPVLEQVISEIQQAHPARTIQTTIALKQAAACDPDRIGQLLSNLLGNAIAHGARDMPIEIVASSSKGELVLSVANGGKPIPPEALPHLFKPFTRASLDKSAGGLGLGLYIASKIADAHRGTLSVQSDATRTRFTLAIPTATIGAV